MEPAAQPLQRALRPDAIRRLQEAYFTSLEWRLLATVALLALVAVVVLGVRRLQPTASRRYGSLIAEAGAVAVLAGLVVTTVYALSVIWRVTFILRIALNTTTVDRFTAAQHLVTVGVIATAYLTIRFLNRSIDKLAETGAITTHQSEVAHHVADVTVVAFGAMTLLTVWGVDLTNVFIGAGAITAVVALMARETLSAMLAGFILLFARPFRVGDWIEVEEVDGVVTDVTLFTTKIQTFDDKHVLVPNDQVTSERLTNYSRNDQLRVEVEVGVDYDADLERARSVIFEAVSDLEVVKSSPEPQVVAERFGDSAILLQVHVWVGSPTKRRTWEARTDVIGAIADAFDREGLTIPFPQRELSARAEGGYRIDAADLADVERLASTD